MVLILLEKNYIVLVLRKVAMFKVMLTKNTQNFYLNNDSDGSSKYLSEDD